MPTAKPGQVASAAPVASDVPVHSPSIVLGQAERLAGPALMVRFMGWATPGRKPSQLRALGTRGANRGLFQCRLQLSNSAAHLAKSHNSGLSGLGLRVCLDTVRPGRAAAFWGDTASGASGLLSLWLVRGHSACFCGSCNRSAV